MTIVSTRILQLADQCVLHKQVLLHYGKRTSFVVLVSTAELLLSGMKNTRNFVFKMKKSSWQVYGFFGLECIVFDSITCMCVALINDIVFLP